MKYFFIYFLYLTSGLICSAQQPGFQLLLDSGKSEFKRQQSQQSPTYTKAYELLDQAVQLQPNNTEARYFLGYVIDRLNMDDGNKMHVVSKEQTIKASEQFEIINKLEPKYSGEIVVLDPYAKLTAIWGSLALSYFHKNKTDSATWAFTEGRKRGGFTDAFLEYNKQLMMSCQKNSILLTYGDNTTFPILYLQNIKGFRKDIIVIDVNLLHAQWYPKYLKTNGIVSMDYSDTELDSVNYTEWEATEIQIINDKNKSQIFRWMLKPTYFQDYLLRGDRILLDIFKQNLYKRDFYFSTIYTDSTFNLFLDDYLKKDGIVSRVLLEKTNKEQTTMPVSENLKMYSLGAIDEKQLQNSKDAVWNYNIFRWTYLTHINNLYNKGSGNEAAELFREMERRFPLHKLPFNSEELKQSYEQLKGVVLEGEPLIRAVETKQ